MSKQTQIDELKRERDHLNSVSPSFCLAKWLQHTVYLQNGMNHSCHHPPTHVIPVEEVTKNHKALHNTQYKKQQMQKMLDGERPSECDYCWRVEDLGDQFFSDRIYKSKVSWSKPYIFDVLANGTNDITPTYMEISFSNVCNLKCAYCSPDLSSKWYDEIKRHGPYPTSTQYNNFETLKMMGKMPIPHKDPNPYVDAFWKWWPELYDNLHTIRLTGGEPLMSKDCWRVLRAIEENPRENLTLAINTNLDVPDDLIDDFISIINNIGPKIKQLQIFTSGESTGKQAEYTRYGLNYDRWYSNCDKVLAATKGKFNIIFAFMTTVNIMSVETFDSFLLDIMKIRRKYISDSIKEGNVIPCMTNYLRWPQMLSVTNLDVDTKNKVSLKLKKVISENRVGLKDTTDILWEDEVNQVERFIEFMMNDTVGDLKRNRKDFKLFVDEYDKRRNVNFIETFPLLSNFYDICGKEM